MGFYEYIIEIFLENNTHFIKDKNGEDIDKRTLTRCALFVYGTTFMTFLTIIFCYMTLPAFQEETTIIVPKLPPPTPGQSCSIMSALTAPLGYLKPALSNPDYVMLGKCLLDPTLTGNTFSTEFSGSCPVESQYSGGPLITNTAADENCDTTNISNVSLFTQLRDMFRSFKCASMSGLWEGLLTVPMGVAYLPLEASVETNKLYYSSKKECLSTLKLNSININRFNITKKIQSATGVTLGGNCPYLISAAAFEYKFNISSGGFSMIPGFYAGSGTYEGCVDNVDTKCQIFSSIVRKKPEKDEYGYAADSPFNYAIDAGTLACPGYDSDTMLAFYNLLYPNWVAEICSAFDDLPPYQCTMKNSPSFISALGNSLAIVQTFLLILVAAATYLLQNGHGKTIAPETDRLKSVSPS